ncbi:hypothetical protein CMQ_5759 [Grosmannia clavigera kw1407]|uniref:Arylsulfotransferase n=1 Tax=Grosmannia clavigera (strain kw1407 / UAMH 11150) TaxID=655863 RepID=F0XSV3_GROCL|nr:uncharacterized protein CMQ_5759 [Grosmannia clavigera kw1407]EFW99338.1 hypothetical protein CMQ_5759 [Grosmannia clavigera kw1407]
MNVSFSRVYGCIATLTVALVHVALGQLTSTDYAEYNAGKLGHRPFQQFHSIDQFAPVLQVTTWNKAAVSQTGSHIFMRHDGHDGSQLSSPLIIDAHDLSTVFVNRSFANVFGTRIQQNFGRNYLTFWEGQNNGGFGNGFGLAYDDSYRLAYNITADNPNNMDLHEFAFTGDGSALVTTVEWLPAESLSWPVLSRLEDASIRDSRFQEIELETNKVLFDWRASDHIDPAESMERQTRLWDPYHLNSIQKTKAGNYLLSMRHLYSLLLIDGRTGEIIWKLGGRKNVFSELPPPKGISLSRPLLNHMRWQHHAHYVAGTNETQMTIFDNYHSKRSSRGTCVEDCSRGLHITINETASPPTVQLLSEYLHPARIQSLSQGSVQVIDPVSGPGHDIGNVFVGWGHCPSFTEHTASGDIVLDVQFSPWHTSKIQDALSNYRAYKMDWTATPYWDPAMAIKRDEHGQLAAYVSWNGATEVKEWLIRVAHTNTTATTRIGTGDLLVRSPRTGFETAMMLVATNRRYAWAEALDKDGNVLRASNVVGLQSAGADTTLIVLGVGAAAVVVLTGGVGAYMWRRRTGYTRLQGDNIELDTEVKTADTTVGEDYDHGFEEASLRG